jgi:hypothetical protein
MIRRKRDKKIKPDKPAKAGEYKGKGSSEPIPGKTVRYFASIPDLITKSEQRLLRQFREPRFLIY